MLQYIGIYSMHLTNLTGSATEWNTISTATVKLNREAAVHTILLIINNELSLHTFWSLLIE